MLALLAVISTMHYEADVDAANGDYVEVPFIVPANTLELEISHADAGDAEILDWGVWSPEGFRGWGGGNTENIVIGTAESSRSYLPGAITPGTWTLVIGKAKLNAGHGHYSVDVTCRDAATLTPRPRAAYAPVVLEHTHRWYKGDFHVHDSESGDANASFTQIAALAHTQHLDFVNLSDHNTSSQYDLQAAFQASLPDLLFLRGAEITTYAGHANGVGLSSYVDHRIGLRSRTTPEIVADVHAQNALFLVNHPSLDLGSTCIGCAWNHPDTPWDQVDGIEIITGKWEVVEPLFVPGAIDLWDEQLDAGHRIAAVSGSDDHRAGAGTGNTDTPLGSPCTLVLADELSEAALIDGVKHGRTIVNLRGPADPPVDFTINGAQIGDELTDVAQIDATVHITGAAGYVVRLMRDGKKIEQHPVDSADFTDTFTDTPGLGDHRYRVELLDDGGARVVVTSHIYAHTLDGPPSDDLPSDDIDDAKGCCNTDSRPTLAPLLLLLPLFRRRRR